MAAGLHNEHDVGKYCILQKAGCQYLLISMPKKDKDYTGFYGKLSAKAGEAGITILIVNQVEDLSGHLVRNELCEPQAAAELIDRLNHDAGRNVFGFCLDTGVCNICGNDIQCFVNTLGDRLKAVVLRDNDGHMMLRCFRLPVHTGKALSLTGGDLLEGFGISTFRES